jgi:hypothetical protein
MSKMLNPRAAPFVPAALLRQEEPPSKPEAQCYRCGATGDGYHPLKECPEPCDQCGRVKSWCTAKRCTASCDGCGADGHLTHRCPERKLPKSTSCRRCGEKGLDSHSLRDCPKPCLSCRRFGSWCSPERCTAKCRHCQKDGHLRDYCPALRKKAGAKPPPAPKTGAVSLGAHLLQQEGAKAKVNFARGKPLVLGKAAKGA